MSLLNRPINKPVFLMFIVGFLVGGIIGVQYIPGISSLGGPSHGALPHRIAKYEGGIALRFAMVHDVIHERFPKHGDDYYIHRNREVIASLATLSPPTTQKPADLYWRVLDDLAVGYVHLGEFDHAMDVMRDKLQKQQDAGIGGGHLYSTYANLGTAMMISSLGKLLHDGPPAGVDELRESLKWVRESMEVNPQAHFGREVWQVKLGEHLLAGANRPSLLLETDMIGYNADFARRTRQFQSAALSAPIRLSTDIAQALSESHINDARRTKLRSMIARVGPKLETPFDEPALGIIGMWRYGAGANAHFAYCLGEIMLGVKQHYIAWSAYERAIRLADGFWADRAIQEKFVEQCRARQSQIEGELDGVSHARLLATFEKELKLGLDYQNAYQQYESAQLAAGVKTDDPNFYDEFNHTHPPIASDAGSADDVEYLRGGGDELPTDHFLPFGILLGGIFAFGSAYIIRQSRE